MPLENPIFIIGTERSGSNLVRLILSSHSQVFIPHPPHIFFYFEALEKAYGDFNNDKKLLWLIKDVMRLIDVHIYPWEVDIKAEEILAKTQPRDLYGVFSALYEHYLAASGKSRWGCKSTFMIDYADRILQNCAQPKLIWLVRDPRDVAVSSRKAVFSPFHPYFTAELWAQQQEIGFQLMDSLPSERILLLRYEDLLTESEAQVKRLCEFMEEPFEEGMLRFFETDEAKKSGKLSKSWENTAKPILKDNFGKYRKQLTEEEIQLVEMVTGDLMKRLDYALDFPDHQHQVSKQDVVKFRRLNRLWHLKVEWNSLLHDKNHWKRWSRGVVMFLIKLRLKLF